MPTTHVILGAGPVGRAVVAALVARGIEPAVVTRSGAAVPGAVSRRTDLTDRVAADESPRRADVVYQCAQPAIPPVAKEFPAPNLRARGDRRGGRPFVAAENLSTATAGDTPITEALSLDAATPRAPVRASSGASSRLPPAQVTSGSSPHAPRTFRVRR